jgi:hypothetical protein
VQETVVPAHQRKPCRQAGRYSLELLLSLS